MGVKRLQVFAAQIDVTAADGVVTQHMFGVQADGNRALRVQVWVCDPDAEPHIRRYHSTLFQDQEIETEADRAVSTEVGLKSTDGGQ